MADDLDSKSMGREAWGSDSPSGHHPERVETASSERRRKSTCWVSDLRTKAPVSEWQTTWTQNPRAERRGGSTPSRGTIHSGRYLSPGVGTADDLDLKSKGRKAWGSESPSGHHVGERPGKGRVQKKKSCEHNGSKEQLGASYGVRLGAASAFQPEIENCRVRFSRSFGSI